MEVFIKGDILRLSKGEKSISFIYMETGILVIKYYSNFHHKDLNFDIYPYDNKIYSLFTMLFDDKNEITFYSDNTSHEVSNILKITKKEDEIVFDFSVQKHKIEYERDINCIYGDKKMVLIKLNMNSKNCNKYYTNFLNVYKNMIKSYSQNKVMVKK